MGHSMSRQVAVCTLTPLATPFWPVDRRFCIGREVTLKLRNKMFSWRDEASICDFHTGQPWFTLSSCFTGFKQLRDYSGVPVLNIKEHRVYSRHPSYTVFLGTGCTLPLFEVRCTMRNGRPTAIVGLCNRETNQQAFVTVSSDLHGYSGMITLGDVMAGGFFIGKTFGNDNNWRNDYCVQVTSNVDVSMCVALCICLDEMKEVEIELDEERRRRNGTYVGVDHLNDRSRRLRHGHHGRRSRL